MMDVELPDGTLLQDVPDGTTKAEIAAKLSASGRSVPKEWMQPKTGADAIPGQSKKAPASDHDAHSSEEYESPIKSARRGTVGPLAPALAKAKQEDHAPIVPLAESAANVVTGMGASVAGGLRGLWTLASGQGPEAAAHAVEDTQQRYTYQPRTAGGQAMTEAAGLPFQTAGKIAGSVGGAVGKVMGNEAAGEVIGEAAVPVAAALAGGVGALRVPLKLESLTPAERASRIVSDRVERAKAERSNEDAGPVNRTSSIFENHESAAERAEKASRAAGLVWGKISRQARKNIVALAADATDAKALTPDAIRRAAALESLPVPIKGTKGQLARDPVQLRAEQQLSNTTEGTAIRERYIEQNKALLDNLDLLAGKASPRAKTAEGVGAQIVDKALMKKEAEVKSNVNRLYAKANASAESAESVSPYPLADYVRDHPNSSAVGWITDRLKKQQILTDSDELGQLRPSRDITLRELGELRKVAERVNKGGGEGAGWAPEVKTLIDKMMDGKGGKEFQAARDAYKAYKSEFDNQGAIKQLVETKGGYSKDRRVALEDVFQQTVVSGSIQDLRNVRQSLLTGSKGTQKQGRKALRELAGETINYIREAATKAGGPDETGARNVSPAALRKAVDRIGDEKLNLLLGDTTASQLRAVMKATDDLKTSPPKRIQGSDTAINVLGLLDKLGKGIGGMVDHVPGAGPVARGAAKMVGNAYELGQSEKRVNEALMGKKKIPATPYRMKEATDELGLFLPGAAAAIQSEGP